MSRMVAFCRSRSSRKGTAGEIAMASFGRPHSSCTELFSKAVPKTIFSKMRRRDGVMRKPRRLRWVDLNEPRVRHHRFWLRPLPCPSASTVVRMIEMLPVRFG
jgi:hypothetical protein